MRHELSLGGRRGWRGYAVALLCTGGILLARSLLTPLLPTGYPYITLFLGVAVAAWYGGLVPGLLTLVLGGAAVWLVLVVPPGIKPLSGPDAVALGINAVNNLVVIVLIGAQHRARGRLERLARTTAEHAAVAGASARLSSERVHVLEAEVARRQAAEAITRQLYEHLANSPLAVVEWDREFRITRWAGQAERVFGFRAEEVLGRTIGEVAIVHPDDRAAVEGIGSALAGGGHRIVVSENRNLTRDGRVLDCEWYNSVASDGQGRMTSVLSLVLDVTERRRASEALRRSEARFRSLAEASAQIIWVTGPDGRVHEPSPTWEGFTGQRWPAYEGAGMQSAIHPDDQAAVAAAWAASVAAGDTLDVEFRLRRADGTYRRVHARGVAIQDAAGRVAEWIGTTIDMEDQRAAEERLRQSAKMEAIGRLAGGLAHDFNNQLQAISGFVRFVERDTSLGEHSRHDLEQIGKAAERMGSLTNQLLAFSRQQVLTPERLDLDAAVVDGEPLLQRLIGTDVVMHFEREDGPKWVQVDRAQLLQVLLNLAINARDALPEGGELVVRTAIRVIGPGQTPPPGVPDIVPGAYALLAVRDSGVGIPREIQRHVFEPFFTTKGVGQGTGLGLATVHGIVTQSRGYVWVDSAPGRGTTFTILLPLVEAPAPAERVPAAEPVAKPGGRVLVVDDEDVVRGLLARTLAEEGYTVVEARHGGEALERLEAVRGEVDLVVSDLMMPVLPGPELGLHLGRRYPGLPVLWISGYSRDAGVPVAEGIDRHAFLQKPVPTELLLQTVRGLIGDRARG